MPVSSLDVPPSESGQHKLPAPEPQKALPAPPSRGLGGILRLAGLALILIAAAAFGWWRVKQNKAAESVEANRTSAAANRAIPVTVAAVQSRTMPIYFTALGTVTAYNSVTIKSRVDGQLLSVNVREGPAGKAGADAGADRSTAV